MNEKTEKTDSVKDRIDRTELYGMFLSYCVSNGEVEIKNSEFFKRLDKLEYESKPSNGKRYILNIKEKEEEE